MEKCQLCRFVTALAEENHFLYGYVSDLRRQLREEGLETYCPRLDSVRVLHPKDLRAWVERHIPFEAEQQTGEALDEPEVDYVSSPEELSAWCQEQFGLQLDPDAEKILRDNLWNLYKENDDDQSDG